MTKKPKIIAVIGPTSSGKTALAVEIARKIGGEIISTDSRQIYRGLDIGSGKVTKTEMRGVPHHLLDIASPKRVFSVAQYQRLAVRAVRDISKRGKVPVLCGGTGLYIDAILSGQVFPAVPPNAKLRQSLGKLPSKELFIKLKHLDPVRAKNIDAKNPHRLIRAIEIAIALGSVPKLTPTKSNYESLLLGLTLSRDEFQTRIHTRLVKRLRQGMLAEARLLHANGLSWKRLDALGLDYRFQAQYLQGKISKQEMMHQIEKESWLYAKRQMVWFKRNKNIVWLHPTESEKILALTKKFLQK